MVTNFSHVLSAIPVALQQQLNIKETANANAHCEDEQGGGSLILVLGFTVYRDDGSSVYVERSVINDNKIHFAPTTPALWP